MQGVIIYIDKNGERKKCFFSGMRYDENPEDVLKRKGVEFKKILEMWDEG